MRHVASLSDLDPLNPNPPSRHLDIGGGQGDAYAYALVNVYFAGLLAVILITEL
jgi:hypothetical protein